MADLAARLVLETRERGRDSYEITDAVTLYEGALVGLESGRLNHWGDINNDIFLGILIGGDDRLNDGVIIGETSDTRPPRGFVNTGGVTLVGLSSVGGGPTITSVGAAVECASSNVADITLVSSGHAIGYISAFRSATDIDVTLLTPFEFRAGTKVLTDNSGGTANDTLEAISGTFVQSEVANNFADLAAKVNELIRR